MTDLLIVPVEVEEEFLVAMLEVRVRIDLDGGQDWEIGAPGRVVVVCTVLMLLPLCVL